MPSIYADLLARARKALADGDGATFAAASSDLGSRLVASGFDGVSGDPAPRVRRCIDALRDLLGRVILGKSSHPRDIEAIAAVERAAFNADTRAGAGYGYPRLPEPENRTESPAPPDPSRGATRSRRAPGPPTDRRAGPEERERSEPQEGT